MAELLQVEQIAIVTPSDIVIARRAARQLSARLGFSNAQQTRLATAVSELTRNVIQYAGTGVCSIVDRSQGSLMRIEVTVEDHGPGISNIARAMEDGFSTSGGLGAGLPGTRRLVDEFKIHSEPGHTCIIIALVKQR